MEHTEAQILRYSELPPAEQRAIEAYVEEHPELEPLLEEGRQLGPLLNKIRSLSEETPDDELLACLAITRLTGREPASPALHDFLARVDARLAEAPPLRRRYEAFAQRAQELEASSDAAAQFEALTSDAPDAPEPPPDDHPRQNESRRRNAAWRPLRWAFLGVAALAAGYGLLYLVGLVAQPKLQRLAAIDAGEMQLEGYRLPPRSGSPAAPDSASSAGALYLRARAALQNAPTSTLGLFPDYDPEKLDAAERLLERVAQQEEPNTFLQLEAYYLLGKTRLAQGDAPGAQAALRRVVQGQGRQAPEAVRLLERLHAATAEE